MNNENILRMGKKIYTKNLTPGISVYGEETIKKEGYEYRYWDPFRSKLAAALLKNMSQFISPNSKVLYLGAASGTTISHVSDITPNGFVFGVEFSKRVAKQLFLLSMKRRNLASILADASKPEEYIPYVPAVDVLYQDVAQKNQVEIFIKNADLFLKKGGFGFLALKAKSVDVTKKPKQIYERVYRQLLERFDVLEYKNIAPFQKDHMVYLVKKE